MKNTSISFVLIEYNNREEVVSCVKRISALSIDYEYDIIVVSNSVNDCSPIEDVNILINNNKNIGFAKANNIAIKCSGSDFVILLNPRVSFISNNLNSAIAKFLKDDSIAALGPLIINKTGEIEDSARHFMSFKKFLKRAFQKMISRSKILLEYTAEEQFVEWVNGAFMIIKKEAFEKVNGFDERYFLYVEDMDICYRFMKEGYKILYFPELKIEYTPNRLSSKGLNRYSIIHFKNFIKFLFKN